MGKTEVLNTIDEQIDILTETIHSKDLQEQFRGNFWNLVQTIIFKDPEAAAESGLSSAQILFHMPTAMFWTKMERYLKGTFVGGFEDQIKFSMKFSEDNESYKDFVKKQINLINNIESDNKVDYLANLTRCFFLFDMDIPLYFRLARFIENCTSDELNFLRDIKYDTWLENNAIVSMLILQGLIVQEQDEKHNTHYVLSSFGGLLKKCALNFGKESCLIESSLRYNDIAGIPQMEPISFEEIEGIPD